MEKKEAIQVEMSDEQIKKMKRLFNLVKKYPATGAIIGQVKDNGVLIVDFFTPEELIKSGEKMIEYREKLRVRG